MLHIHSYYSRINAHLFVSFFIITCQFCRVVCLQCLYDCMHILMIDVFRIIVQGPQHKEYTSSTDTVGPDLSKGVNGTFSHRCTRATDATEAEADATDKCLYKSSFLVNEKGSVHLSFTQEDVSTKGGLNVLFSYLFHGSGRYISSLRCIQYSCILA